MNLEMEDDGMSCNGKELRGGGIVYYLNVPYLDRPLHLPLHCSRLPTCLLGGYLDTTLRYARKAHCSQSSPSTKVVSWMHLVMMAG